MGYTKEAFKGAGWTGGYRILSRIFAFVRIGILARILNPLQFGVVGVATLVFSFLETFTQLGFGVFFIQEKKNAEKYINTAWVISIIRGLIIFLILYFSSGYIAKFFNSSDSEYLIKVISFVAIVRGFINPSRMKFIKSMNFKKETFFSFSVFIVDFLVTIITTLLLRSPIGIVYGLLFGAITEAVLSLILLKPRPRFTFNIKHFKTITNRGKWVTALYIFNYLYSEGDDAFVSKMMPKESLGIYQMSYKISTLPLTEISQVFNTVAFPIFSKFADDMKRLVDAFRRFFISVFLIVVPIGIFIYFFPNIIVTILLGNQWEGAIPIIRAMALFGVLRSLVFIFSPFFNSLKLQKYMTYTTFISLFVMSIVIYPLTVSFGLMGTVYSILGGTIASLFFNIYLFFRIQFINKKDK